MSNETFALPASVALLIKASQHCPKAEFMFAVYTYEATLIILDVVNSMYSMKTKYGVFRLGRKPEKTVWLFDRSHSVLITPRACLSG